MTTDREKLFIRLARIRRTPLFSIVTDVYDAAAMLKVLPAVLIAVALGGASLGCLSSGGTPALVARQADPTPLAKCQVKKSQASPLVTEWPASEKAHLEGMLSERTVVVSYSGCELRILDGCRVQGGYKFTRTSLANDTIEISDADELYAKLPLGAVSLEGELEKTGRLAVRTTVAGQLRLDAEAPALPTAVPAAMRRTSSLRSASARSRC